MPGSTAIDQARRRRRAHRAARPDRRPRPCHGARLRRAPARPHRHDLARRPAAAARAPMPPPIPTRKWILGRGWNQESWADKRFPTAADLDAVVGDRPVWLGRVDGHASVANSAALKAAGITAADQGARGRADRERPVRRCRDRAGRVARSPPRRRRRYDAALAKAQELMLSTGLTAAADMGTSPDDWAAMNRAGAGGHAQRPHPELCRRHPGDARDQRRQADRLALRRPAPPRRGQALRRRRARLARGVAQGALSRQARHARAQPDQRRRAQAQTDDEAAANGYQLGDPRHRRCRQCAGDRAPSNSLGQTYTGDRRWRIEHAQIARRRRPAAPRQGRDHRLDAADPPDQRPDDGRSAARAATGSAGLMPGRRSRSSGARLAFGSDFPVESPNPFPGLAAAVSRQDPNGQPPGGWRPQERVSFEQALAGFTRGAAYAGFAEAADRQPRSGQIGRLHPRRPRRQQGHAGRTGARRRCSKPGSAGEKVWQRPASGGPGERGR